MLLPFLYKSVCMHICVCMCIFEELLLQAFRRKRIFQGSFGFLWISFLMFNEFPWCFAAEGEALVTGSFGSFAFCFTLFLVFQWIKKGKSSNIWPSKADNVFPCPPFILVFSWWRNSVEHSAFVSRWSVLFHPSPSLPWDGGPCHPLRCQEF